MPKNLTEIIECCIPHGIVKYCRKKLQAKRQARLTEYRKKFYERGERIRHYFLSLNPNKQELEIRKIIEYFKENNFSVFPYDFTQKYRVLKVKSFYDKVCGMHYVLHNGKRMYFPKSWTAQQGKNYYKMLCMEQDENSPHRYETVDFSPKNGDVIVDVGAAEGIWALTYAEVAKKIYLFECDPGWEQALQKTFEPYKEKTIMVNKYVSDKSDGENITLDDYFDNETINFIKADIEGYELKLLKGMANILTKEKDIKLLLCAYHNQKDEEELKIGLEKFGFYAECSKGYMLFAEDENLEPPYLRRGLVRARKL